MDRKEALAELIAKVEAGRVYGNLTAQILADTDMDVELFLDAYEGSLDAAKALHDAVLPGWAAIANTNGTVQLAGPAPDWKRHTGCKENNPARAWLLVILKALHDQADTVQKQCTGCR